MIHLFDDIDDGTRHYGHIRCPICGAISYSYCWECDPKGFIDDLMAPKGEDE